MVPEGWSLKLISDVAKVVTGSTPSTKNQEYYGGDIPFVSPADLGRGKLVEIAAKTLTEQGFIKTRVIRPGSTLFTCIGSTIGKLGMAGRELATNQQINSVIPHSGYDDDFIFYQLELRAGYIAKLAGTQAVPIINKSTFESQSLLVPSALPEQKKIAQILTTWDKAITTTEQLLANSLYQKKALMQQLLTGKKRLLDQSRERAEGGWVSSKTPYKQLPDDWSEISLSEVSSFITKGATPTTYGYEWQATGIPFIRSECVGESGFKDSGLAFIGDDAHQAMSRSKVYSGDVLITITGNVGRACKLPESIPEANINQHIAKITLSKDAVCPDFVFHCLQDRKYRVHFERITTGQAYPQISLVQVRGAVIPLPKRHEQQKIAAVLSAADQEITILQKQLEDLKKEKKALMQQLLTGKRRVLAS